MSATFPLTLTLDLIIGGDDSRERAGGGLRIGKATGREREATSHECSMRKRCVTMSSPCDNRTTVNLELLLACDQGPK